MELLMVI